MQNRSRVAQASFEIGAVLAKLTPVERTVTLGAAVASTLNEVVPLHLHQAHLQLLIQCVTVAMNGASQEHKVAATRALHGIVAAAATIDSEILAAKIE